MAQPPLERADYVLEQYSAWTHVNFGKGQLPSDSFRQHFLACFLDDKFGLQKLQATGEDIVSYECDYPHSDSLWPYAPERLFATLQHVPETVINKVTHENALRFMHFDPVTRMGGKANCTVGALRSFAKNVNVNRLSFLRPSPLQPGKQPRIVISGDMTGIFAKLNKWTKEAEAA
jgi:hypothetical protein